MKNLLVVIVLLCSIHSFAQTLENDRLALVALYNSTNGNAWINKTGWTVPGSPGDNPCGWFGITCSGGRVTSTYLPTNNLMGTIPASIVNLDALQFMNFANNYLSGNIPADIGNMSNLKSIELFINQLTGSIPASIGNLSNLINLTIHNNQFSGSIPASLGNLTSLQALIVSDNFISGNLPPELGNLTQLRQLNLYRNLISGSIPSQLGNLSLLSELQLSRNQLTGSIPAELGNLTLLKKLGLYYNQLSGSIPSQLGNLTGLTELILSNNQLSGSIPSSFGNLTNLSTFLSLNDNQLSGIIPDLSAISASCSIVINNNKFTFDGMEANIGKLDYYAPQALLPLQYNNGILTVDAGGTTANNTYRWYRDEALIATNTGANFHIVTGDGTYRVEVTNNIVTGLTLSSSSFVVGSNSSESDRNALIALYNATNGSSWNNKTGWNVPGNSGDDPCGWHGITCANGRVTRIDLFQNNLTGNISVELGKVNQLQYLRLGSNHLTGTIPIELGNLISLKTLHLAGNDLTGNIPAELSNLKELTELFLNTNQLSGNLPTQFGNLTKLQTFWIQGNQLSGTLPDELGNLTDLRSFITFLNQFSGSIPSSIGNLTLLNSLMLSNNNFTGTIPPQLGQLSKLESLNLGFNQLSGSIPSQLGNLSALKSLYLKSNLLSGTIPSELGQMNQLEFLTLSNNSLTGNIPSSIGDMSKLINLDLANNSLSGALPSELGNLVNLKVLYLIYNNLTGSIPASFGNLKNISELNLSHNSLGGTIPDLSNITIFSHIYVDYNRFTFDGMESNFSKLDFYSNQSHIPVQANGNVLSVNAGGTMSNNTYRWYRDGLLIATVVGNNTYLMPGNGTYRAEVKNSIVTGLTLISENYVQDAPPLPVTLVNFTAKHTVTGNLLQWTTTSETNNAGFDIERSNDAQSFDKIGFVDGRGESGSLQSYQFIDQNPFQTSYYRLKQLDHDGTFAYSRIVQVRSEMVALKVYPNPAKGQFLIESSVENETVQIYNLKGIRILEKPVLPLQTISTANWQTGTYLIRIGDKSEKVVVEN